MAGNNQYSSESLPVHYLPCSFDTGTAEKVNFSRYFTPTIERANATLSNGFQGSLY